MDGMIELIQNQASINKINIDPNPSSRLSKNNHYHILTLFDHKLSFAITARLNELIKCYFVANYLQGEGRGATVARVTGSRIE